MEVFYIICMSIGILQVVFFFYQFIYAMVTVFTKSKTFPDAAPHKFGILIAARNEEAVIGNLIESIQKQDYPADCCKIFVTADNCTDKTAEICRKLGCTVFERENKEKIGKGYVLDYMITKINEGHLADDIDGYLVFDADNLLDKNFLKEMNKVYSAGYKIVTSYRNSKNYGSNWVSAGYGLWYLRETKYLNASRMRLGTSCTVSGTGFLFDKSLIAENGWKYFILTEDMEFSSDMITKGIKIGCAEDAMLYDEQPISFRTGWKQRLRWCKGLYRVVIKFRKKFIKGFFKDKNFACYDLPANIVASFGTMILQVAVNTALIVYGIVNKIPALYLTEFFGIPFIGGYLSQLLGLVAGIYGLGIVMGGLTTITEWKKIKCPAWKKIVYIFTFPFFMLTYVPISVQAIFAKVWWKPIEHTVASKIDDIK